MRDPASLARALLLLPALAAPLVMSTPAARAQGDPDRVPTERFVANAVPPPSFGAGRFQVEIRIQRWSTDEEHDQIVQLLSAQGARRLPRTLRRQETVGSFRQTGRSPWTLRYAREIRDDGTRKIVALADRPIVLGQSYRRQRSTGHETSVITLELNDEGVGRGELIPGIEVAFDEESQSLGAANRLVEPIELADVRKR